MNWGEEGKGETEDEMVGWHLNGHSAVHGGLKKLDTTEQLNNNKKTNKVQRSNV